MIIRVCVWCKLIIGVKGEAEEFLPGLMAEQTGVTHGICRHCDDFTTIKYMLSRGLVKFVPANADIFSLGQWGIEAFSLNN